MPNLNTLGFQQWKFKHFKIYRIGAWPPAGGSKGTKICEGIVEAPSSDLVFFSVGKEAFFFHKILILFSFGGSVWERKSSRIHHGFVLFVIRRQILIQTPTCSCLEPRQWRIAFRMKNRGAGAVCTCACVCMCVCSCACVRVCVHTCIYTHMRYLALWHTRHPFCSKSHSPCTQLSEFLLSLGSLSFSLHWVFPYARSGDKTPFLPSETWWFLWYSSLRLVLRTLLIRGALRIKHSVARASVGQSQSKIVYQKPQRVLQCEKKDYLNLIHYCPTYLVPAPHVHWAMLT